MINFIQTINKNNPKLKESININVGSDKKTDNNGKVTLSLKIRKGLGGHLMIMDHNDIDIVIMPDKKKILTFPKSSFQDNVYDCQNRFFEYMSSKGVIKRESIQSGEVFGSIQAEYPDSISEGVDTTQVIVFSVGKFIEEEKPHMQMEEYFEEEFERELTKPDEEESTELGEIPAAEKKGTISPNPLRRYTAYGPY